MISEQTTAVTPEDAAVDGIAVYPARPSVPDDRAPLLFVHGGMHAAWVWADAQRWFTDHGRASLAFDWRSHGQSDPLPDDEWVRRGLLEVADDIATAAGTLPAEVAPVVVAHSMGGLAALAYAARGGPLSALVLICPVVPAGFAAAPVELPVPVDPERPFGPLPADVSRMLFFGGTSDARAAGFVARLQPESPAAVVQATQWTAELDVSPVDVPTLVITADNDLLVPPAYARNLAAAMGADVVEISGAGHGVPVDDGWHTVMQLIDSWTDLALPAPGRA